MVSKKHFTSKDPELFSWKTVPRQGLSHRDLIFAVFSHINNTTLGLVKNLYSKCFSRKVKGPKSPCFPGYFQEENMHFFLLHAVVISPCLYGNTDTALKYCQIYFLRFYEI